MSKKYFTKKDLEMIKQAVQKAENKTSGEITTAFIKESYDYAIYELLFSVLIGTLYFFILTFFYEKITHFLNSLFWIEINTEYYTLVFYGISTFLVIIICYFISNISFVDRIIIPKKVMTTKVHDRAVRHFYESGIRNTKDKTGILIFISFMERRIELVADIGISEKIEQKDWQTIVEHIIFGIKKGKITKYLVQAIEKCGVLLAEHFPIQADDVNELQDEITVLDK